MGDEVMAQHSTLRRIRLQHTTCGQHCRLTSVVACMVVALLFQNYSVSQAQQLPNLELLKSQFNPLPTVSSKSPSITQTQEPASEGQVKLNFPDPLPMKLLVDYVSNRLDIKILYDNVISNKRITIKAPSEIPAESLLNLLESSLKMSGLALVDADLPGWKKIVPNQALARISKPVSYTHLTLPTIYSV